jgi:UDP-N-acetylmuramoyl-tripeptide--D-alanyl-D-alanine ligase
MRALWTSDEIADAVAGQAGGDWQATGVSIDSRTMKPGELFVALVGPTFDGHDFIAAALEKKAGGILASRRPDGIAADAPLVLIADTQQALEALGRAARDRTAAKILGVTGSVGKTGTKEALRVALEPQGKTAASVGSLNNHWGVPLSLSRMPRDADYGIFELGMNHPGEIDGLTRLVRPHVAVITTIEPAHLGFFSSVEAIADAKAEIFNGMTADGRPAPCRLSSACNRQQRDREPFRRDGHLRDRRRRQALGDEQSRRPGRRQGHRRRCRRRRRRVGDNERARRSRPPPSPCHRRRRDRTHRRKL